VLDTIPTPRVTSVAWIPVPRSTKRSPGIRVEAPQELHAAVGEVLRHDGPALLDVVTVRQELVMQPTTTFDEAHKFGMFMLRQSSTGERRSSSIWPRST
jgi:hypothetical protein